MHSFGAAADLSDNENFLFVNQGGAQSGTEGVFLDSGQVFASRASLAAALTRPGHD